MKNKFLTGMCMVLVALVASVSAFAQDATCEKWCTNHGRSMCCPGYERGGAATSDTSDASGRWYESDVQRCQTLLQQPNIDADSELLGQFQKCQGVKAEAEAEEKAKREERQKEMAAKAAVRQKRQPIQATPELNDEPVVNANFTNMQNFGARPGEMPVQPLATE